MSSTPSIGLDYKMSNDCSSSSLFDACRADQIVVPKVAWVACINGMARSTMLRELWGIERVTVDSDAYAMDATNRYCRVA